MDAKRAARIEALLTVQGFAELGEELAEAEERYWRRHRAELEAGKPFDQREVDFMRGKFTAAKQIMWQPHRAHAILERIAEEERKAKDVEEQPYEV